MQIINIHNTPKEKIIKEAVATLAGGRLLIYPTETCYGLGADATNPKAVDKVLAFKGGRRGKPISVAVADQKMAQEYVVLNSTAINLYRNFLPGPLTVVSQSRGRVDPRLESPRKTLGIRIPEYPLVLEIIQAFGRPITATSANVSGGKTPYQIEDILEGLPTKKKKLLGLILNAGKLPPNPPSTVVDTTLNEPTVLRQGEIDFAKLKAKSVITNSARETQNFASQLLKKYLHLLRQKTLIFALQGELGAGKTQFAKGLGKMLDIKRIVSPTFTIIKEYPYQKGELSGVFYHLDAWRLKSGEQALHFIQSYLRPGNIIAIEWIQKDPTTLTKLAQQKKVQIIWIELLHLGGTRRRINFAD